MSSSPNLPQAEECLRIVLPLPIIGSLSPQDLPSVCSMPVQANLPLLDNPDVKGIARLFLGSPFICPGLDSPAIRYLCDTGYLVRI